MRTLLGGLLVLSLGCTSTLTLTRKPGPAELKEANAQLEGREAEVHKTNGDVVTVLDGQLSQPGGLASRAQTNPPVSVPFEALQQIDYVNHVRGAGIGALIGAGIGGFAGVLVATSDCDDRGYVKLCGVKYAAAILVGAAVTLLGTGLGAMAGQPGTILFVPEPAAPPK